MVPNWTVAWFKANEIVPFIFLALAHPALQRQDSNPINPTQQIIVTTQMVHCKSNSLRDIHHSAWQTSSQGNYICINCKSSTTSQPNLFNARVPFWCQLATSMLGSTHALAFRLCELSQGLGSRPKQLKKSNIPQYEDSHKKHPGWSEESHQENEDLNLKDLQSICKITVSTGNAQPTPLYLLKSVANVSSHLG